MTATVELDGVAASDPLGEYEFVSFSEPPVNEVALSIQFGPETFDLATYGLFVHRLREAYPDVQRQPVLPPIVETFDQLPGIPSINIQFADPAAMPRLWLITKEGTELVQLQHDRISYNWRRLAADVRYPRYSHIRERLTGVLSALNESLNEAKGQIEPSGSWRSASLCEVAYVNTIAYGSPTEAKSHPDLARAVSRIRSASESDFLGPPEDAQFNARWRIPGSALGVGEHPVGRLHVSANPSFSPSQQEPIYIMTLTARINLASNSSQESAMDALDLAHKWVVLGFEDLTTEEAHGHWGKTEVRSDVGDQ